MKFVTVDMARALTERLANAPKTKEVMVQIYNAALEGKSKIYLGNKVIQLHFNKLQKILINL